MITLRNKISLQLSCRFLFDFSNQILVEKLRFTFIVDLKYEKLSLFCSYSKMIYHYFSSCRQLQQDVSIICVGEKTINTKIQQLYRSKVVDV